MVSNLHDNHYRDIKRGIVPKYRHKTGAFDKNSQLTYEQRGSRLQQVSILVPRTLDGSASNSHKNSR